MTTGTRTTDVSGGDHAHAGSRLVPHAAGAYGASGVSPVHDLQVGDLVFIRVTARPFLEVAYATLSWTNHVGIVVDAQGDDPLIAESTFPFARTTRIKRFLERSENGRYTIARLAIPLDSRHRSKLIAATTRRMGTFYDTGFNLHSRRQFCSRFVREVIEEATGIQLGETETFSTLLERNPDPRLGFWRLWYFGRIPWRRLTVTPASVLDSPHLRVVRDSGSETTARTQPSIDQEARSC
ncbi:MULTISPECIES: YebB family permuted papain-like enzyme [Paraburkholderia]|uniref:YebB family permuted papain-like enzyme n=1 Tax=Paraburkholderia TaxID=1822464 RepID=UPI00225208B6|nr:MULTISPECIES: YebB family permuted papain-like enzyme [Paraburkholderia]MCX4161506.1 YebB family permuted papain-like enzyme [Paraburkholderia megapolitana]MDN7157002.1 YebB family permuted papain-like enzyme [Paraburkholderia sp. CHISQ3]MDQ6494047.1 YebB family permuted papain-like enzyme [Paraburkholderia megapolitana]